MVLFAHRGLTPLELDGLFIFLAHLLSVTWAEGSVVSL